MTYIGQPHVNHMGILMHELLTVVMTKQALWLPMRAMEQ